MIQSHPAIALPDTTMPWALRWAPRAWRGYIQLARLDRPIGWQLLLLPCWWSTALVARTTGTAPNLTHLVLFAIGAIAMRGAGSTFNDIVDRDLDGQVERTRGRPVASGRVSRTGAALFVLAQALVGLAVVLCFNGPTIAIAMASLLIVAAYPFAKRVTSWPQAVLGLAFAWGALVGWSATTGSVAAPAMLLYAAAILWTIGYDTIYALQDRTDDAIVGIGSTALAFGDHVRPAVAGLFAAAIGLTAVAVWDAGAGAVAWAGVVGFAASLTWQVAALAPDDAGLSLALFRSNRIAGLILFAGFALDALIARG